MILCVIGRGADFYHYEVLDKHNNKQTEFKNMLELKKFMRKHPGDFNTGNTYCLIRPSKLVKVVETHTAHVIEVNEAVSDVP